MRLLTLQLVLGLVLLSAAALWPRPDRHLLLLASDDAAAARLVAAEGWRILDIRDALGWRMLRLAPAEGSGLSNLVPSDPGVLLALSIGGGALCRAN